MRVSSFLTRGSGDQTQIMLYDTRLNPVSHVSGSVQKLRYFMRSHLSAVGSHALLIRTFVNTYNI